MSWNSSKRVSTGAALPCDHLNEGACGRTSAPGQPDGERLLGEGLLACMPKRLPWQLPSVSQIPQPPKAGGARSKWFFYQRCVSGWKREMEVSIYLCSRALAKGRQVQSKLGRIETDSPRASTSSAVAWRPVRSGRIFLGSLTLEPQERVLLWLPADLVPIK